MSEVSRGVGRAMRPDVGIARFTTMPDRMANRRELSTESGNRQRCELVLDPEHLVLDEHVDGVGLVEAGGALERRQQTRETNSGLVTERSRHDQSSRGSRMVITGSPPSPGPATSLSWHNTASLERPSRGTR